MIKLGSPAFKRAIFIIIIVLLLGLIWACYFSSSARQSRNLNIADRFVKDRLIPLSINNKIFKNVSLGHYTGDGGCIWVSGIVKSEEDLKSLKQIVESSNPPLHVKWSVVIEDTLMKEYESQNKAAPPAPEPQGSQVR